MDHLYWEFSLVARAVNFQNLSDAARNLRISQPQLSRILQRVEEELKVPLLDRSSKKGSRWTSQAKNFSEFILQHRESLTHGLGLLQTNSLPKTFRVAVLEGLIASGIEILKEVQKVNSLERFVFDVLDLEDLESAFGSGLYDVVLSSRKVVAPKKSVHLVLGFQDIEIQNPNSLDWTLSPFEEHTTKLPKNLKKLFVSNSLQVRDLWSQKQKTLFRKPSVLKKQKGKDSVAALAILSPHLHEDISKVIKLLHKPSSM